MRLAFSAAAATSGLILLGLALYGQPAQYVQDARRYVNEWLAARSEQPPPADSGLAAQMNQLQQEVAMLQARLVEANANPHPDQTMPPSNPSVAAATAQRDMSQPGTPAPAAPPSAPTQPAAALPTPLLPAAPAAPTPQAALPPAVQPPTPPAQQAVTPPNPSAPAPPAQRVGPSPPVPPAGEISPSVPSSVTQSVPPAVAVAPPILPPFPPASAASPAGADAATPTLRIIPPESAEPPARSLRSRTADANPPAERRVQRRPDAADPATTRVARANPTVSPDFDESQSVLARLRQATQPPPPRVPESPAASPSPAIPRLTAARAALTGGHVEEAVRLLQEAQLQLVFRPVGVPGGDSGAAARGAGDVAHALEALSANNPSASARFVDRALAGLSGVSVSMPPDTPGSVASGYAPAYPPR